MVKITRQVASHADVIRIHAALGRVVRSEGGYAFYTEGNDDASVAKQLGVGESSVASIRREFFGRVKTDSPVAAMRKELDDLQIQGRRQEQMIVLLTRELHNLIDRYNKLVLAIALNRSSTPPDVKHLQVPIPVPPPIPKAPQASMQ